MASTITTVSGDKRILLTNSGFARPIYIGTNWTKIRIGMRVCQTDAGADLSGTPRWAVGVSSGSTNIFGDSTVDNWIGVVTNTATPLRANIPPVTCPWSHAIAKKVGSTLTIGGTSATLAPSWDTSILNAYFVDITKGSPNYTVGIFGRGYDGVANVNISLANYLKELETASPSLANYTSASGTIAADESTGTFTHVNISWNRQASQFQISDLAVIRMT